MEKETSHLQDLGASSGKMKELFSKRKAGLSWGGRGAGEDEWQSAAGIRDKPA